MYDGRLKPCLPVFCTLSIFTEGCTTFGSSLGLVCIGFYTDGTLFIFWFCYWVSWIDGSFFYTVGFGSTFFV